MLIPPEDLDGTDVPRQEDLGCEGKATIGIKNPYMLHCLPPPLLGLAERRCLELRSSCSRSSRLARKSFSTKRSPLPRPRRAWSRSAPLGTSAGGASKYVTTTSVPS